MDFSRVRAGELLAGISGGVLFIVMFLPWFEANDTTTSAWAAFDFIDIVLFLAVIAAVGLAVLAAAQSNVQLPVAASAITAGLGILGTLFVVYRIIEPVGDASRRYGLFLGLIAVIGVAFGGWVAMQEEDTSFGGEADRLSR